MQKRIRNHIRSNVVGYIALFFTLSGGVAWATHPGGANTISSGDIINAEVKNNDLDTDAVGSAKIADGSIKNPDLSAGASSSNTIADGGVRTVDVANDAITADKLATLPAARVRFNGSQVVPAATFTDIFWSAEDFDTAGAFEPQPGEDLACLTAPIAGTYVISGDVDWENAPAGYRVAEILRDGSGFSNKPLARVADEEADLTTGMTQSVSAIERLAAGDCVTLTIAQGSGGPIDHLIAHFSFAWMGP
jgi:hypothetical protein